MQPNTGSWINKANHYYQSRQSRSVSLWNNTYSRYFLHIFFYFKFRNFVDGSAPCRATLSFSLFLTDTPRNSCIFIWGLGLFSEARKVFVLICFDMSFWYWHPLFLKLSSERNSEIPIPLLRRKIFWVFDSDFVPGVSDSFLKNIYFLEIIQRLKIRICSLKLELYNCIKSEKITKLPTRICHWNCDVKCKPSLLLLFFVHIFHMWEIEANMLNLWTNPQFFFARWHSRVKWISIVSWYYSSFSFSKRQGCFCEVSKKIRRRLLLIRHNNNHASWQNVLEVFGISMLLGFCKRKRAQLGGLTLLQLMLNVSKLSTPRRLLLTGDLLQRNRKILKFE